MSEPKPVLVQETHDSPRIPADELVKKFLDAGVEPQRTLRLNRSSVETVPYPKKRLLGLLGTRDVMVNENTRWVELVRVWPVFPRDMLETDDLYTRYLATDGRVFEEDIDGWPPLVEVKPRMEPAHHYDY